jgi:hypothetical protein
MIFQRFGFRIIFEKRFYPIFCISVLGIAWYQIWTRNISQNQDLDSISVANMRNNLVEAIFGSRQSGLIVFIIGLSPFFLVLLRNWYFFAIGLISIAPNILVTVGGAELFGYQTHYHSIYLPILVGLSTVALLQVNKSKKYNRISISLTICLGIFSNLYYSNHVNQSLTLNTLVRSTSSNTLDAFGAGPKQLVRAREEMTKTLQEELASFLTDKKSSISAPESYMPILTQLGFRKVDYFPIGVGSSEYIVLPLMKDNLSEIDVLLYGHFTVEKNEILSRLIRRKLNSEYSKLHQIQGPYGTFELYSKKS